MPESKVSVFVCAQGHIWPATVAGSLRPGGGPLCCPECGESEGVIPPAAPPAATAMAANGVARADPLSTWSSGHGDGATARVTPATAVRATPPGGSRVDETPSTETGTSPGDGHGGAKGQDTVATTTPAPSPGSPRPSPTRGGPVTAAGYTILGELGRGAMGVVYKARHEKLKRVVALKMIRVDPWSGSNFVAQFQAEAEAVARLHHPNVVQIYEVGELDGRPYLALEFVTGGTLKKRLDGKPQPVRAAAQLIDLLARAVHAAHLRGIVHRDLKPANILLEPSAADLAWGGLGDDQREAARCYGVPKISDFGLAKRIDEHADAVGHGEVVGTPMYMAPEQARGETEDVGPAADVYALGAIFYEMLTGRPPFPGGSVVEVLSRVATEDPVPPRRLRRHLPRDVEAICRTCLEKEPRSRYPTALALADDLRRFHDGRPIRARPANPGVRAWRWSLRYPVPSGVLLAVFVVLVVGQWRLRRLSNDIVARTARASAAQQTATIQKTYALYAGVAGRVRDANGAKLVLTHEYPALPNSVPIPARFAIMLGEEMEAMSEAATGGLKSNLYSKLHVYSNYPFRYRAGNPPRPGSFGADALAHYRSPLGHNHEPFHRTETDQEDHQVLRYATPFVMERPCLGCHNDPAKYEGPYKDNARTDWKVGDVRGVLVVDIPLTREYRQTDDEVFGTYLLMGGAAAATFAASWLGLTLANRRPP